MEKRQQSPYFNASEIKNRGWTDTGIKKFLGSPDLISRNRKRRRGTVNLYEKTRVLEAENTEDFKSWKINSDRRSQLAKQRAQVKREQTVETANKALDKLQLKQSFKGLSYDELKFHASTNFLAIEKRREERSRGKYVAETITSRRTDSFYHRIVVNWLRHDGTTYDSELDKYFSHIGVNIAKDIVRERIYELIAEEYPYLKDECDKQLGKRRDKMKRQTGRDVIQLRQEN